MEPKPKTVPIKNLKSEEGAEDMVRSENMRPYMRLAEAIASNQGMKEAISAIRDMPLEQRYLWRVLSALKWGFADFDNVNVVIDRKTLTRDDRMKVAESVQHRPVQFCLFIKALLGTEAMEEMMTQAIAVAKRVPEVS